MSHNVRREMAAAAHLLTSSLSVLPSAPQFQLRLWLSPSLLFSPLASLCLSLKLTRSASVKPSWADTKLIEAVGFLLPLQRRPALLAHLSMLLRPVAAEVTGGQKRL